MYYIAAILIPHDHISVSHWFHTEARFEAILRASVISLQDPLGLANLVLLDLIKLIVGCQLYRPWHTEIRSERLSGHGTFGSGQDVNPSDLGTQHLASAAREVGVAVGTTSYCIRLVDRAEQMVSVL
jgi:hypothetical protein